MERAAQRSRETLQYWVNRLLGGHLLEGDAQPTLPQGPISSWSVQEINDATAAAFSVISGVKIISEKDVQKQRALGKTVTPLQIKDVFYGQLNTSKVMDEEQHPLYYIPDSAYDPQHDCDFTNYKGDDTRCVRGNYPYKRPAGWSRKAINVIKKYEDDVWLGQAGWRDLSSPGEWPVSYHGTKIYNVPSIVKGGYDTSKCVRQALGPGIYSTPEFKVAEGYAEKFTYKGKDFKCILQNRVNLKKTEAYKTGRGIFFVTPDVNDIRPYGVCLKKI
ncbi:uncharacterized protein [Montipora foliosa]|uniref:uncharacterized protein n=1 Tax=Montipora foliosa TaxID=591990 RepID=UPI0035F14B72